MPPPLYSFADVIRLLYRKINMAEPTHQDAQAEESESILVSPHCFSDTKCREAYLSVKRKERYDVWRNRSIEAFMRGSHDFLEDLMEHPYEVKADTPTPAPETPVQLTAPDPRYDCIVTVGTEQRPGFEVRLPEGTLEQIERFTRALYTHGDWPNGTSLKAIETKLTGLDRAGALDLVVKHAKPGRQHSIIAHFPRLWPYPITKSADYLTEKAPSVGEVLKESVHTLVDAREQPDEVVHLRLPKEVAEKVLSNPKAAIDYLVEASKQPHPDDLRSDEKEEDAFALYERARALLWSQRGISIGSVEWVNSQIDQGAQHLILSKAYEDTLVQAYTAMDAAQHAIMQSAKSDNAALHLRDAGVLLQLAQTGIRYAMPKLVPTTPPFIDLIDNTD